MFPNTTTTVFCRCIKSTVVIHRERHDCTTTAVLDDPRNRFDITSPSHPDYNAYILGFNKMLERSPDKLDELQSNTRSNSQKILLNQENAEFTK